MSDELDDEASRLFAACRAERPSASVRERALSPVPRRSVRRSPWVGPALVLAASAAIFGVTFRAQRPVTPNIGAERLPASPPRHVQAVLTPKPTLPSEPSLPATSKPTSVKSAPKPRPAATAPLSLEQETQALERARTSLQAGDPGGALAELDAYGKAASGGALALEATLLRIQALASAGRTSEASELARRFVAANPNSPLVDRARRYLPAGTAQPAETTGSETTGKEPRNEP